MEDATQKYSVRMFFVFDDDSMTAEEADRVAREHMEKAFGNARLAYSIEGAYDSEEVSASPDPQYDVIVGVTPESSEPSNPSARSQVNFAFSQEFEGGMGGLDHVGELRSIN